jgi:hypothetical protein
VYAEFADMRGLSVTVSQAQRLFGLDEEECTMVLQCLTEFGILRLLPDGRYTRAVE